MPISAISRFSQVRAPNCGNIRRANTVSQESQEEWHDSFLEQSDALSQICGYDFAK